jgi:hypothetical protein
LAVRHAGQRGVLRLVLEYALQQHQHAAFHYLMSVMCFWIIETGR